MLVCRGVTTMDDAGVNKGYPGVRPCARVRVRRSLLGVGLGLGLGLGLGVVLGLTLINLKASISSPRSNYTTGGTVM